MATPRGPLRAWSRRDLLDQCSAYACPMRAYARPPCRPPQLAPPPRTRSSAAATQRAHPACACVRRIDKAPKKASRNLRRHPEREPAGHSVMHTQKRAKNQRNWWRGSTTIERPSGYRPDEAAGHSVVPMYCIGSCPTHLNAFGRPRPEKLVLPEFPPLASSPITAPGSSPPG